MSEIIERAVESFNKKSEEYSAEVNDCAYDYEKIRIWVDEKEDSVSDVSLFDFLLNPKYAFLQTLAGDEKACYHCLQTFNEMRLPEGYEKEWDLSVDQYRYCDCEHAFTEKDSLPDLDGIDFEFLPKHQVLAERLFRLLYAGKEEEAIKLLEELV